jgi:hypothetical protein|tara:strand:+ start:613 stop:825 length:213 start_codon:yes stop_codon:yes gene_type:complete
MKNKDWLDLSEDYCEWLDRTISRDMQSHARLVYGSLETPILLKNSKELGLNAKEIKWLKAFEFKWKRAVN